MNSRVVVIVLFFISLFSTAQESYQWKNVIIGGGGYVTGIITCPTEKNLIYAKTDVGGAYRWEEESQSWIPLTDWVNKSEVGYLGIESIAIDPQNPNRIYMAKGLEYFSQSAPSIFYSDDYGNNFTQVKVPFMIHGNGYGRGAGERLVVDPNNSAILYYGTRKDGLWRSIDAAKSWSKVESFPVNTTPNGVGVCAVVFDPDGNVTESGSQTIFAGVSRMNDHNLYVSHDSGENWKPVGDTPADMMPQRLITTPNNKLYATFANGSGPHGHWQQNLNQGLNKGALLKYNITEQTWADITPNKSERPAMSGISFQYDNPDVLIASTTNTWWRQSWSTAKVVYGDEIFRSADGGETWTAYFSGNRVKLDVGEFRWGDPKDVVDPVSLHWATSIEIDPFNPDRVFVVSGNGIFMTNNLTDNVSTWKYQVRGLEETVPLDLISPQWGAPLISVIGDYDGFRHNDLNSSPYLGRHNPRIGTTNTIDFAGLDPRVVIRAGSSAYFSTDNAKTWKSLPAPVSGAESGSIAISADGKTIVWCPSGKQVFTTMDYKSWQQSTGTPSGQRVISDKANPNKFYIFYNRSLYFSNDKGNSFTKGPSDANLNSTGKIRAVPGFDGELWIPERSRGLFRSEWIDGEPHFIKVDGPTRCEAVGFGKPAPGKTYPAVFIWGTINNVEGVFRSDDEGETWVRVNDENHQFGGPGNGDQLIGDPRVYGRVYMTTAGRGIVYGDIIDGPDAELIINPDYLPEIEFPDTINNSINTLQFKNLIQLLPVENNAGIMLLTQEKGSYQIFSLKGALLEYGAINGNQMIGNQIKKGLVVVKFVNERGKVDVKKFMMN